MPPPLKEPALGLYGGIDVRVPVFMGLMAGTGSGSGSEAFRVDRASDLEREGGARARTQ